MRFTNLECFQQTRECVRKIKDAMAKCRPLGMRGNLRSLDPWQGVLYEYRVRE